MKIKKTLLLIKFVTFLSGCYFHNQINEVENSPFAKVKSKPEYKECTSINACALRVHGLVSNNWNIPPSATDDLKTSVLVILDERANLLSTSIKKSSGNTAFDKSAIIAITKTAPFVELHGLTKEEFANNFRRFYINFEPDLNN